MFVLTVAVCVLLLVLNQLFNRDRWGWRALVDFLEANGRTFVELVGTWILTFVGMTLTNAGMTR